jgi:SAM-dependent methyltransferase
MTSTTYVHGYTPREAQRLLDQAGTLAELFHHDTAYPPGSRVLEAGCGVGAQTVELARRSPGAEITAVDISSASLAAAERRMRDAGLDGVRFRQADLLDLPFPDASFDHVILCFVLEHLPDPDRALRRLVRAVRPGGTVTAIEGDHGSTFFHPDDPFARRADVARGLGSRHPRALPLRRGRRGLLLHVLQGSGNAVTLTSRRRAVGAGDEQGRSGTPQSLATLTQALASKTDTAR